MQHGKVIIMSYNFRKKLSLSAAFRRFSGIILFMSFFVFAVTPGFASWKLVAQFNATVNASFFFNEQRGFIAIDGKNGIKRTSDGGQTWLDCTIPSGFGGFFTDIFMRDSLNGWVTIEEFGNNSAHGLWATSDGGVSWQVNPTVTGLIAAVYQTPSSLIITDRYTLNRLSVSTTGGASFANVAVDLFNGINFVDDLHGVASDYRGTALWTNDGGRTWQPTSTVTVEAWGVYAQKGTSNFVIAGEKIYSDPIGSENVSASNDYGVTWQTVGVISGKTTGHIAGISSVIYTQALTQLQYPNPIIGMNRSTDGGRTWKGVGGPSSYRDTRFSVTGCLGGVVYAFDESGGVWKTTDGGDGLIQEFSHSPNLTPDQINLSSSTCNTVTAGLTYTNLSCNGLTIESIGFSDSTNLVVSTGALSFIRYPKLPQTLDPASSDSLVLKWDPKKLGSQKFPVKTYIKVHGNIINSTSVFDTLLGVNTQSLAPEPEFHPDSIIFPATKTGEQICTTFVFKNSAPIGNPPFILESAVLTIADSTYQITFLSSTLPASVASQDSLTLEVCFRPLDSTGHRDSLVLKTDCFSFAISLDGRGSTGLIFASDLDFASVNVGDTLCENVLIKNIGSSPFTLTKSLVLSDTINFSTNTSTLPVSIGGGGSVPVEVCFHPKTEGTFSAAVDWGTDLEALFAHSVKSNSVLSGKGTPKAGVNSLGVSNSFTVRPNPTQNELSIALRREVAHEVRIEIFDALGKKVFGDKRNLLSGMNVIHIDTRNLSAGIYLVRVGEDVQNFVKE